MQLAKERYASFSYFLIFYISYFTITFFPFTILMPFCIFWMR